MSSVVIENVFFAFDGAGWILEDVSLRIEPGELVLVEGPSGGGKTTLLRIGSGLEVPARGCVSWGGRRLHHDLAGKEIDRRRGAVVGNVFSDFRLAAHLSGRENILLPARIGRRQHAADLVEELIEAFFEAEGGEKRNRLLRRPVREYSDGQKERIAVIRSFSLAPQFVFADEMFGAVQPELKARLWAVTKEICRSRGIGLLLVTHDGRLIEEDRDFSRKYHLHRKLAPREEARRG